MYPKIQRTTGDAIAYAVQRQTEKKGNNKVLGSLCTKFGYAIKFKVFDIYKMYISYSLRCTTPREVCLRFLVALGAHFCLSRNMSCYKL